MRLTKSEKEIYKNCLGECKICLLEGGCNLEKKIKTGKEVHDKKDN